MFEVVSQANWLNNKSHGCMGSRYHTPVLQVTGKFPLFQSSDNVEALMEIAANFGRKKMEGVNASTSPGLGMASAAMEEATVMNFWMIFLGYWLVIDRFILCISMIQNV